MRLIIKLILQIIANAIGIFIAVYFLPKYISFTGDLSDYLIVGAILAVANLIIRPILKLVSTPLIFISFGLFLIIINMIILFAVDWFVEELIIKGIWGYIWVTLIISILNAVIAGGVRRKK